jgi:hypothetical protein
LTLTSDWTTSRVFTGKYEFNASHRMNISEDNVMNFLLYDDEPKLEKDEHLVAVSFNTIYDASVGQLTIIIKRKNKIVIGAVPRL